MYKNFRECGIPRLLRLPQGGAVFDFRGALPYRTATFLSWLGYIPIKKSWLSGMGLRYRAFQK